MFENERVFYVLNQFIWIKHSAITTILLTFINSFQLCVVQINIITIII